MVKHVNYHRIEKPLRRYYFNLKKFDLQLKGICSYSEDRALSIAVEQYKQYKCEASELTLRKITHL
jgi:hypothetical protein